MAAKTQTNRGAIFRNTDKRTDQSPDYTGIIELDGRQFRAAGWVKTTKPKTKDEPGEQYLSLALTPINDPQSASARNARPKLALPSQGAEEDLPEF